MGLQTYWLVVAPVLTLLVGLALAVVGVKLIERADRRKTGAAE